MSFTLRKAKESDCPRLMELVQELAEFERAPDQITVSPDHFVQSGFGPHPVWWAWVACDATGTIVGFALYYIRYSTWKGQRLYLEDLIVTKNSRGTGAGKALLDKIIEVAREEKFSGVVWQVLDWNQPAVDFYKRYGVKMDQEWITCTLNFS